MKFTAYTAEEARRVEEVWRKNMKPEKHNRPRKVGRVAVTKPMLKASERRKRLLAIIEKHQPITTNDLMNLHKEKLSPRQMGSQVQKLRERGEIRNIGSTRKAIWQLTDA